MSPDDVKWDAQGLAPAIVQDAASGEVLALAWMNRESLRRTLETRLATFWSRSRGELWVKGSTSGNTQAVRAVALDCDQDAILLKVVQAGRGACHTGRRSCFYRAVPLGPKGSGPVTLEFRGAEKAFDPDAVYGDRKKR